MEDSQGPRCPDPQPHRPHEWYGKPAVFRQTCPGVSLVDMTTYYFGKPWAEPMQDRNVEMIGTPVGDVCLGCGEPIVEGDRGVLRPAAIHMECELLRVVGHIYGVCECTGRGKSREEALELLQRINHHRRQIQLPAL